MQILSTLTDLLRVQVLEAIATSGLTYVSSWAEYSGPTIENPELKLFSLQGTYTTSLVTLVNTPTSGNQNQVKFICLHNLDTILHNLNFCINTGGTQTEFKVTLQVGDTLFYSDTRGWYVLDSNGNTKTAVQHDPLVQVESKIVLSGSTNGQPISVAATATPGTLIHDTLATGIDEIYIWATNRTATAATLTIEWGGTGTSNHLCAGLVIPANSPPILISNGIALNGALRVRAFSGTANAINLSGHVNRIS